MERYMLSHLHYVIKERSLNPDFSEEKQFVGII